MSTFQDIMVQNMYNNDKQKRKIMEIGKKLRELREGESLTQQKLAEALQIPRVNYTRYETNVARPDYETLIKIADFYDVSLDEIFERTKAL